MVNAGSFLSLEIMLIKAENFRSKAHLTALNGVCLVVDLVKQFQHSQNTLFRAS